MLLCELWEGCLTRTAVKDVCFDAQYDVIVCGLGNSGALAALFSAENGLSVLGLERLFTVGGTTTAGGIPTWYFGCAGGRAGAVEEARRQHRRRFGCELAESGRFVLEQKLRQQGVPMLLGASVCGVYLQRQKVTGVRVLTAGGIRNIACRVLMDCTGDGAVARMAGCETVFGRAWDGLGQPYSRVCRVRSGSALQTVNMDFGRVDPLDDRALSRALVFSCAWEPSPLRQMGKFVQHMPLIGVREGRHIVSEEQLCLQDVFDGNFTAEPAFYTYSDLDKHGWDKCMESDLFADWAVGANLNAYNMSFPVPWKALIPKDFDGLLVPCRALGVDCDVAGSVRMIPDMNKTAEAAADIALLALRHGCPLKQIPYEELRSRLQASGCLDKAHDRGLWVDGKRDYDGGPLQVQQMHFLTQPQQLEERLATLRPGLAIWSARRMGAAAQPTLRGLLSSPDENTRRHAAFALAATGDTAAVPLLRQMVEQRDDLMLRDCRKYNQHRAALAMYHLGRLADADSVELLLGLLTAPDEHLRPIYQPDGSYPWFPWRDFRVLLYQFFCNAVAALVRIGEAHPAGRARIAQGFVQAFADGSYYEKLTSRPPESFEGGLAVNLAKTAFAAKERWGV